MFNMLCLDIVTNYHCFMRHPLITHFRQAGGEVYIATEHRDTREIMELYAAGHRFFAEKYVQEAARRLPDLRRDCPDIRINFFGHLQQNKAIRAMTMFDAIETIDRPALALRLRRLLDECPQVRTTDLFIQINTGREPQKSGALPEDAQALIDLCRRLQLPLTGLMAIPPRCADPAPHFKYVRNLANHNGLAKCQMGMSNDFAAAIQQGATAIRIGRAIFCPTPEGTLPCPA